MIALTLAPHPVSKHASSTHNTRLVGGGVAPLGWWQIIAKLFCAVLFCNACSSLPGNNGCPLPGYVQGFAAWKYLPVPCLGTFAVPAWDACQFSALEHLPVPCLGTFCSHPGTLCQFLAWERLPVPSLEHLPVPCLGMLILQSLPRTLCQFPA